MIPSNNTATGQGLVLQNNVQFHGAGHPQSGQRRQSGAARGAQPRAARQPRLQGGSCLEPDGSLGIGCVLIYRILRSDLTRMRPGERGQLHDAVEDIAVHGTPREPGRRPQGRRRGAPVPRRAGKVSDHGRAPQEAARLFAHHRPNVGHFGHQQQGPLGDRGKLVETS